MDVTVWMPNNHLYIWHKSYLIFALNFREYEILMENVNIFVSEIGQIYFKIINTVEFSGYHH